MKINLGCGQDYRPGWLNIDVREAVSPDMVVDLEQTPWPLESDSAQLILLKDVLQCLGRDGQSFLSIMSELYRIAKPDAVVEIHAPHPMHRDFIADPTHVRPIVPEVFQSFDLNVVEQWQAAKSPRTPFASYLEVDFETTYYEYLPDPHWSAQLADGRMDIRALWERAQSNTNVIQSVKVMLKARKPFGGATARREVGAYCLERYHGLGDVLMVSAAAKAVKELTGKPVFILTAERFKTLLAACPTIDGVLTDAASFAAVEPAFRQMGGIMRVPLVKAKFGMWRGHQIDAYLGELNLTAAPAQKEIVLDAKAGRAEADRFLAQVPPPKDGKRRILVHPAKGDPNRTWPAAKWEELAKRLSAQGHQVILVGGTRGSSKGVHPLAVPGVFSAVDKLSYLGTLALMDVSHVVITTDSGLVQLAGATSIHIVGIFTVAAAKSRVPFRRGIAGWGVSAVAPACPHHPCYLWMKDAETSNRLAGKFKNAHAEWCLAPTLYECLTDQISVHDVLRAFYEIPRETAAA